MSEENVKWGTKGLSQGYRYDAKIVSMEWTENDFGRKQLNISIETKDGSQRTIFLPYSTALDSKWGVFQKGLEVSGVPIDLNTLENPEKWLEGKTFTFEQFNKTIAVKDRETDEMVEKNVQFTRPIKYIGGDGDMAKEESHRVTGKSSSVPSKPAKKLEDRFLDALADGDKSVESLPEELNCDFGEVIELMNRYQHEGKIEVLKGGLLHLVRNTEQA